MKDRVSVNPGRVLVTPENGSAFYATVTRADNPTQEGDPINKSTLLKDETAAKFGLDADAVPDDTFALLSRFQNGLGNEYVWVKTKEVVSYTCKETVFAEPENTITVGSYHTAPQTFYYADEFEYSENGQTFILKNPNSFSNTKSDYSNANMYAVLKGKYVIMNMASSTTMFFYPQDCNIYNKTIDGYNTVVTSKQHMFSSPKKEIAVESFGCVNSPDTNAYPTDDGYIYRPMGRLGYALSGAKVLLWENASPQSSFSAQTINIDLSEYTHVCVTANNSYLNECALVGDTITPIGASTVLLGTFNSSLAWRVVEMSVNGVSFQSGLATASQVDNRLLIPFQIYGIKVVSQ